MATAYCENCGVETEEALNFCRRCGAPASRLEATTRNLDPGPRTDAATGAVTPHLTGPAYVGPGQAYPMAVGATASIGQTKKTNHIIYGLVGALVILIAIIIAGAFIFAAQMRKQPPSAAIPPGGGNTIPVGIPSDIHIPPIHIPPIVIPPIPPIPPMPPVPPSGSAGIQSGAKALVYPGATITSDVTDEDGAGALTMQTTDSVSKVVDWYKAKLHPKSTVILPVVGTTIVGNGHTVMITDLGGDTKILVTRNERKKS